MRANLKAQNGKLSDGCENRIPHLKKFRGGGLGAGGDMIKVSKMFL